MLSSVMHPKWPWVLSSVISINAVIFLFYLTASAVLISVLASLLSLSRDPTQWCNPGNRSSETTVPPPWLLQLLGEVYSFATVQNCSSGLYSWLWIIYLWFIWPYCWLQQNLLISMSHEIIQLISTAGLDVISLFHFYWKSTLYCS